MRSRPGIDAARERGARAGERSVRRRRSAAPSSGRGGASSRGRTAGLASRLALGCAVALAAASLVNGAEPAPAVVVRAPGELARIVPEVEAIAAAGFARELRLTGLAGLGGEIVVELVPEASAAARGAPPWIAGWAQGGRGRVALMPSRAGRYPDRGLGSLLRHEVAHVLVARAARGGEVPRWFDEGIAMAAGRDSDLGDRARVALAVMGDGSLPLARLDAAFAGGESQVHAAYALAGDVVRALIERHGERVTGEILAGVARGERFEAAFLAATGARLREFERDYWSRRTLWDRWVPVISSSVLLWTGVALLTVAAFRRKRRRAAELRQRWALEEAASPPSERDDGPPN